MQNNRPRIRKGLRKNIKTTFSKEGFEVDKERDSELRRQYEDNLPVYEFRLEQERLKLHDSNLRKVNRSLNRLEKQNKNFLEQMEQFRNERMYTKKDSSSNIRALSGNSTL